MSQQLAYASRLSVEDYLASEDGADIRHEYIDGELYAMTGASRQHVLIVGNLYAHLRPLLRGTPCQLFANDLKVRLKIAEQDIFYYPDLILACDPDDRETYYCTRPCLLVEVLSNSTARIDRREKLLAYQTLPSLMEYLLVDQHQRRVEVYRRAQGWTLDVLTEGTVRLDCLDHEVPLDVIYEDVPAPDRRRDA
ncbi:Uma2 family endonuclease [Allochromatium palmeri]|uniref:Uma2 family endonuclease n=1 Tax=Allochromatium palmeri TaxID=231048 RepID=A0A6N8ED41_9GAMM|nr:Uma2 family endonuclease [Allochromatium palmeri]MTW22163.1 Uma2 family endonuclease [Allochromatium palmeri]